MSRYSQAVKTARAYYNSDDADNFYARVWGGEDIHIGLYDHPDEAILTASHRTVERMADTLGDTLAGAHVLDIGGGYGGAARYLARARGATVVSLNLSEVQNERGRRMNAEQGLADRVDIVDGDFENIPYPDDHFDVVWSQDAMLHSGDRGRVIAEVARVLKPGGTFIFTDPMTADDCPAGVLQPVLDRISLETMGSPGFYRAALASRGFTEASFADHSDQVPLHYTRVHQTLDAYAEPLAPAISSDYVANMRRGLEHWVAAGRAGYLTWGIMRFDAPD
ncbi:methyltransferase domain-containing protein [Salinisphaera sp. T31B1]|uniref:methyltransferase domain-containing protein n=1 Tax=Salinisphaera sp. T31B1 TaxID=727963 RepID=UPI00333E2247